MTWELYRPRYGHAPDLPETHPDSWRFYGSMPTSSGKIQNCRLIEEVSGAGAGSGTFCRGAVVKTDAGVKRYFLGFSATLYESTSSGSLTDRSGASYTADGSTTWSFAQYGAITLAVNKNTRLQQVSTGADFADANANAPKGNIVAVGGPSSLQFVIVAGYDDGTYTPDGWYCSPTPLSSWATSTANSIAKARLIAPTGPITAMIPFREGMVAFKKDSMWLGRYVGGTFIWEWKPIAYDIGCVGKGACVNAGDQLYFAGPRGFYVFDGSYPRLIPGFVHETWASIIAESGDFDDYNDYVTATYEPDFHNVIFHATVDLTYGGPSLSDSLAPGFDREPQLSYTYNVKSGIWTHSAQGSDPWGGATSNGVVALLDAKTGITGNKKLAIYDYATTGTSYGYMVTPRLGGMVDSSLTLKGIWPNWYPSVPGDTWQGADGSGSLAAFATHGFIASTSETPTNNTTYQRLEGVVSGLFVQASTTYKGVAFDGVLLDLERPGGKR